MICRIGETQYAAAASYSRLPSGEPSDLWATTDCSPAMSSSVELFGSSAIAIQQKRPGEPGLFEIGRPYWAGAGAGSAGGVAGSAGAGCVVVSAGGGVLCVVVLSAVSLHAAMPKRAIAEAEAKINFFITVSS
jgi:hypothetical protein